ncbi:translation initiation factor IF-3 [Thermopetrobacter sp. TC1]|uniref:translation initiation factor IF-3 n=1 Tax=Thermopetrobacter sp. TC1 TaxID=1495045 RepID=UPI001E3963C1|nr:translation initiation factor IF-3 [Thermopetrobacter sp. TC1]
MRRPHRGPARPRDEGPRVNDRIRAPEVLVIDENGEKRGVMPIEDALALAEEAGLDLVEVAPNANPPVCKILDYGKFKYQAQKRAAEARKKQKTIEVKEIKMRPTIDTHDYEVKMRSLRKFISKGDKVKVSIRFRGREVSHADLGRALLERVLADAGDEVKVELQPKMEGRQMVMILAPNK